MNRRTSGILLSQGIDGFLKYKVVEGLSQRTLTGYESKLKLFQERVGDLQLTEVNELHVEDFLFWLRTDYTPQRVSGNTQPLSDKTIYNYWTALKSFFSWATRRQFTEHNPMDSVPRPKFTVKPIAPLTRDEIEQLLQACKYSRVADTTGRRPFKMQRPTYRRDRALILFLLDTGLRASELCSLRVRDVDLDTGEVTIRHGKQGGAKGAKGRTVYIGKGTRRTLWRYLAERQLDGDEPARLFVTMHEERLNRDSLRLLFRRLGQKSDVKKCHPHRLRHTFAINYLRAHGDVLTLQALLGHSSLEMVRRYARIAKIDLQRTHERASPVDNWAL